MSEPEKDYEDTSFVYTFWYWAQNTVESVLFLALAIYTVFKLQGKLLKKNYLVIFCFSFSIFIRYCYESYIYWIFTNQGKAPADTSSLAFVYSSAAVHLFYNTTDSVLNLFFYNIVLKMINFWDKLYYENVYN